MLQYQKTQQHLQKKDKKSFAFFHRRIVRYLFLFACLLLFSDNTFASSKETYSFSAASVKKTVVQSNLKNNTTYSSPKPLKLKIKRKKSGQVIRYTTDGQKPSFTSKKYKSPLKITASTTIRAQVFKGKRKVSSVKTIHITIANDNEKAPTPAPPPKTTTTLTQYFDQTGSQAMFYTLKAPDGKLAVIDGGRTGNANQVRQVIKQNGGIVDLWILTHPHPDHIGAFNEIFEDPQGIVIKQIYDTPLDYTLFDQYDIGSDEIETYARYLSITKDAANITHLAKGNFFSFSSFRIQVLNAYDQDTTSYEDNPQYICNDSSLVLKFTGEKNSLLFCADAQSNALADYLVRRWGDTLKAEYVQVGHHGNASFPSTFYDYVNPKIALFDAPSWLVNGSQYTTMALIRHLQAQGVTIYDHQTAPNVFEIQ